MTRLRYRPLSNVGSFWTESQSGRRISCGKCPAVIRARTPEQALKLMVEHAKQCKGSAVPLGPRGSDS